MIRMRSTFVLLALSLTASSLLAQTPAASSTGAAASQAGDATATPSSKMTYPLEEGETRAQMLTRMGFDTDPGENPDPKQEFIRFGRKYTIERFDKKFAVHHTVKGWVKPAAYVNFVVELYQENDQYVWALIPVQVRQKADAPVGRDGKPIPIKVYKPEELKMVAGIVPEFEALPFVKSDKTIRFTDSSSGLPSDGSWRNSPAVADMNEDGFPDIIAPPQRFAIESEPSIFLGDGKGNWKKWEAAKWPFTMMYGSVVAGDINKDGHVDLVFAVHLYGVVALLGDGKGNFVDASKGLPKNYPTRRVSLTDADGDGDLDIVVLSEGPTVLQGLERSARVPKIRLYLNEKKASEWKLKEITETARELSGDWLSVADVNGDRKLDLIASSTVFNGPDIMYLGEGSANYKPFGRGFLPFFSYYHANATGKFSSKQKDDVILSYLRAFPQNVDPRIIPWPDALSVVGLERISWTNGQAVRTPIARWASDYPIWGMAAADFDGDGSDDLVFLQSQPRQFVVLLNDGKGNFRKASVEGLEGLPNVAYDVTARDVNGDHRPDIIVLYEQNENTPDGAIKVYLNAGIVPAASK